MKEKMLEGKVAIVSGASYGMGETMAELFAKEGAKVVMTARGKEKLEAAVNRLKEQGLEVTGVVYCHQQCGHRRTENDRRNG